MDALRKVGERLLMVVFFFAVTAILFLLFNEDVTDRRVATMADEFIMEITKDGVLTKEEYLIFADAVASLQEGYEIELVHQLYVTSPYYELTDEATIHDFFEMRNVLDKSYVPVEEVEFEEPVTDGLRLQEQSNASVLASLSSSGYVPLPDDDVVSGGAVYHPVVPVQECYDGEQLVTVVRVEENGMMYYLKCDPVTVTGNGTAQVDLKHNGTTVAYVDVTVYPRTCVCAEGHESILTREMVEQYKMTGSYGACACCALIPEFISVNGSGLTAQVGTTWSELALTFTVTYLDGHTEVIDYDREELYHDYDENYCGTQEVTVSYKGLKMECFDIMLIGRDCVSCGSRCEERSYADYMRFNFCDACLAAAPFYFGTTYVQEDVVDHSTIMELLDSEGAYFFCRGDYLKISLERISDGLPIPFLTKRRTIPVITDGFIRTTGR